MNLIMLTCEIQEETSLFIESVRGLSEFWEENGFTVSLYREKMKPSRFLYSFLTEKSVDDLTRLIQEEPSVRELFERIKDTGGQLVVSMMERVA